LKYTSPKVAGGTDVELEDVLEDDELEDDEIDIDDELLE